MLEQNKMNPTTVQIVAAMLFGLALIHTFSTKFFEHLAHTRPAHAGFWHLLAEVEIVFGVWAMAFIALFSFIAGKDEAMSYLDGRNFTEPLFVFAIMVVAGSRPVLQAASAGVQWVVRLIPLPRPMAFFFTAVSIVPLLGSFITEPAAMTLAALLMRDTVFAKASNRLKYAALGVLFVNVSIGGTLTSFAAPPILMVAAKWQWDSWYLFSHFGWKAAIAVALNALVTAYIFKKELVRLPREAKADTEKLPLPILLLPLVVRSAIVIYAHHPALFMGLFLFFMGLASAYPRYQNRLILREGLLVAFFLAGLVVLGGQQQWWLEPMLKRMDATSIYFGATALTAVTDNAALTYLGSLVNGLSDEFKYALVAGAVTGGGLTVIANAPNPAGVALLKSGFNDGSIGAGGLLLGALAPTAVAACFFLLL